MSADEKPRDYLDPIKEAQAVAALRSSLEGLDEDQDLLEGMIEGETSLFEIIDRLLDEIRSAEVIIDGVDSVVADLTERKRRATETTKRTRAVIEQAMTIAGVSKITRPTATLSMSQRKPSVLITQESDIPARFWKAGAPVLDKKALTEAVFSQGDQDPIPGVVISNGAPSLTLRVK